jgi:hypothetical protein
MLLMMPQTWCKDALIIPWALNQFLSSEVLQTSQKTDVLEHKGWNSRIIPLARGKGNAQCMYQS